MGAASSLEDLGGLDPSSGLQTISTLPFVCSQSRGAPGESLRTTEGVQLAAGKKGEETCLEAKGPSQPSPQTLPIALGAAVLASWEPHLVTPVASVFLHGVHRGCYSFSWFMPQGPRSFPFQLINIFSLQRYPFSCHFPKSWESSS